MRTIDKKAAPRVVIDKTLDTKYADKVLFPEKIEKAKQLLGNNKRFGSAKSL